jgi:hypothetical protein
VPTGRRDGTVSTMQDALNDIPKNTMTFPQLANLFASKGLGVRDLVWLSGAHLYMTNLLFTWQYETHLLLLYLYFLLVKHA